MLKKFIVSGAVVAGFAALSLAAPAYASDEYDNDVATQSGNTIVCGNRTIGDISVPILNLAPVTFSNNEATDCSIRTNQN
ncbi:hypothetical protein [Spongiactinospora sp. TRM90649]|uniref:hypothetical protein n=1 Tax=Spongiactinospora sp. TRM90649 TaxID=3031114 RepID=UPI0023F66828|nr:hypothetical protein [Spongiactinospora sp. TRM90649]MDF5751465.1 hypothetical protein [Spongiactinospora sp. TRM90649]